jgi:hypothetical protein
MRRRERKKKRKQREKTKTRQLKLSHLPPELGEVEEGLNRAREGRIWASLSGKMEGRDEVG